MKKEYLIVLAILIVISITSFYIGYSLKPKTEKKEEIKLVEVTPTVTPTPTDESIEGDIIELYREKDISVIRAKLINSMRAVSKYKKLISKYCPDMPKIGDE